MRHGSLTDTQIDVLREVISIGVGNAVTSLSEMTGQTFKMEVPSLTQVLWKDADQLLAAREPVVGVWTTLEGDLAGRAALMFPWGSAQRLWNMVIGSQPEDRSALTEMETSAMTEVGNIILSTFVTAVSTYADVTCRPRPPSMAVDQAPAQMRRLAAKAGAEGPQALALNTVIYQAGEAVHGYLFFFPVEGTLDTLFNALGVEEAA